MPPLKLHCSSSTAMPLNAVDCYSLLGLDPSASNADIRQAYKKAQFDNFNSYGKCFASCVFFSPLGYDHFTRQSSLVCRLRCVGTQTRTHRSFLPISEETDLERSC